MMTTLQINYRHVNMNNLMQDTIDQGGRLELVVGNDNYQHLDMIAAADVEQETENA